MASELHEKFIPYMQKLNEPHNTLVNKINFTMLTKNEK